MPDRDGPYSSFDGVSPVLSIGYVYQDIGQSSLWGQQELNSLEASVLSRKESFLNYRGSDGKILLSCFGV